MDKSMITLFGIELHVVTVILFLLSPFLIYYSFKILKKTLILSWKFINWFFISDWYVEKHYIDYDNKVLIYYRGDSEFTVKFDNIVDLGTNFRSISFSAIGIFLVAGIIHNSASHMFSGGMSMMTPFEIGVFYVLSYVVFGVGIFVWRVKEYELYVAKEKGATAILSFDSFSRRLKMKRELQKIINEYHPKEKKSISKKSILLKIILYPFAVILSVALTLVVYHYASMFMSPSF